MSAAPQRRREVCQRSLLERVLRVEAEAPDVARDDEQIVPSVLDFTGMIAITELNSGSRRWRAVSSTISCV